MTWREAFVILEQTAGKHADLFKKMWQAATPPPDDEVVDKKSAQEFYGRFLTLALGTYEGREYDVRMCLNEAATFFNRTFNANLATVALCDPTLTSLSSQAC